MASFAESQPAFDPDWLAQLRQTASLPPRRARLPLLVGTHVIGSVEPELLRGPFGEAAVASSATMVGGDFLHDALTHWSVLGNATASLQQIARALRAVPASHVDRQWRDELLAVHDHDDQEIARVERGAVRALGIATRAVHLIGHAPSQHMWIQQRSWSKATDPGLWDTLMGGMVAASDSVASALERETWEEAGLRLEQVQQLRWGGHTMVQKPNGADGGVGYMVERTDWYEAMVPNGTQPHNQDGEVAQFSLVSRDELVRLLHRNAFTTEAALVLVECLGA